MSQNKSTPFLVTDAKNLTLIDANRENSPWCTIQYNTIQYNNSTSHANLEKEEETYESKMQ